MGLQLKSIIPTIYSEKVYEVLMLDKLSEDDVKRTIDSLKLSEDGIPMEMLTMEDYKEHTEWQEFDDAGHLFIDGGNANIAEEQIVRDILRGK